MSKLMEFMRPIRNFLRRRVVLAVLVVVIPAAVLVSYGFFKRSRAEGDYITGTVSKSTIEMSVVATGTVNAVTTVQVGSQVSGTIESLNGTDFNSLVKRGQVIARLDQSIYMPQLKRAQADLQSAEANVETATAMLNNQKANLASTGANLEALRVAMEDASRVLNRNKDLAANRVISTRDLESAQATYDGAVARYNEGKSKVGQAEAQVKSAEANVEQARAQVKQSQAARDLAQANLDHTIVSSPVDGVVVSRNVDVGQTVAASLQAPTLFTIANDLTQMQVIGKVDEADIGKIGVGGPAKFAVDAFPEDGFTGRIKQVRLNSQTQQNVVVYDVVIEVGNPELKLRPGMTANITIPVTRRENVLTLPNAALRFRPQLPDAEMAKIMDEMRAKWQDRKPEASASAPPADTGKPQEGTAPGRPEPAQGGGRPGQDRGARGGMRENPGQAPSSPGERRWGGWKRDGAPGRPGGGPPPGMAGQQFGPSARGGARAGARPESNAGQPGATLTIKPPDARRMGRSRPQVVWVLTGNKKVEARWARTGITDGRLTEILDGDLKEGDVVVLGQNIEGSQAPQQQRTPFGGGNQPRGGGMPGGGRRPF